MPDTSRCATCCAPLTDAATTFLHVFVHGDISSPRRFFAVAPRIPSALFPDIVALMQAYTEAMAGHAMAVWKAAKQISAVLDEFDGDAAMVDLEVWNHFWRLVNGEEV